MNSELTEAIATGLANAKKAKKAALPFILKEVEAVIGGTVAPEVSTPSDEAAAVWEAGFKTGKNYALKAAFQVVEEAPVNPYVK